MVKKIIDILFRPYYQWKKKQEYKKRIEELKKRDPFIYK